MPDFDDLTIQPSNVITAEDWNEWLGKYDDLINERNNGLVINGVTIGRDTKNDENGVDFLMMISGGRVSVFPKNTIT